jgi:hypothetical protein
MRPGLEANHNKEELPDCAEVGKAANVFDGRITAKGYFR